jgi:hypothetical protein
MHELGDGLVKVPLEMPEARVPPRDVALHASAPALPQPEPKPPELERAGCELAQGYADCASARAAASEENAWSEIVGVRPQAARHRSQQLVREMLQRPSRSARELRADADRR